MGLVQPSVARLTAVASLLTIPLKDQGSVERWTLNPAQLEVAELLCAGESVAVHSATGRLSR